MLWDILLVFLLEVLVVDVLCLLFVVLGYGIVVVYGFVLFDVDCIVGVLFVICFVIVLFDV